jgi:ABC-type sugar transport system ATPase subunit
VTEDRKRDGLVMQCTIRDNVSMASYDKLSRWGVINRRTQASQVQHKVHELDIRPPLLDRLASQLSGGNQQKLVLAKWLMTQGKILILDEPTRGVDVATKVEIYQLISDLAAGGIGILLISSELPEILGLSDRALVMREGRIVGEFTRAEASEEQLLAAASGVRQ